MLKSQWFKILRSLGLEFWLPLPLLGFAFWLGSGFFMDGVLNRPNPETRYLKVDILQSPKPPKRTVLSIKPEINKFQGISKVKIKTDSPVLKELELEFSLTEISQLEAAISQELGLPIEDVRRLMQNPIENK